LSRSRPWRVEAHGAAALIELFGLGAYRFGIRKVIGSAGPIWLCTFPFRASSRWIQMARMGLDHRRIAAGIGNGHGQRGLATVQNGIGTIWMWSGCNACTSSCTKPHSLSR
jgi:hypothetical protein